MSKKQKLAVGLTASLLIIIAVGLSLNCSQEDRDKPQQLSTDTNIISDNNKKIEFIPHDQPPKPVSGYAAIQKNLQYPEIAQKAGIEGRVLIWAFVDKNGKVTKTKVKESIGNGKSGCEEAAINAIKSVKWEPAGKEGNPVGVWVMVPVEFALK